MSELLGSVAAYLTDPSTYQGRFALQTLVLQHIQLTVLGTGIAALIAIPLGLWIGHRRRGELLAVTIANIGRAVPDFGIILMAIVVLGLGIAPILLALVALAIPPILINTYVGIRQVDADVVEAGEGMGMRPRDVLLRVEIPNAVPLIMTGARTAAIQVVGTAALAAIIGGGGLGRLVFDGFAAGVARGARPGLPRVVVASVLIALLAIAAELLLARLERRLTPRGLRSRDQALPGGRPAPGAMEDPEDAVLTARSAA